MNILDIFLKSDILTRIVMLILFVCSILSWGIIIYQMCVLRFITRDTIKFEDKFLSGTSLDKLYQDSMNRRSILQGLEKIFHFGFQKFFQLYRTNQYPLKEIFKETTQIMHVIIQSELQESETHITILSTIASISPYFGLLGTILSIVNIFFKLGSAKYITLQIIAPGVSEALIFTAGGLVVSIPSILGYYHLNLHFNNLEKKYKIFSKEFLSILQNQVFLKKI